MPGEGPVVRERCPVCSTAIAPHCRSFTCPWHVCPMQACRATVNLRRGVGWQRLPGAAVRAFEFAPRTAPPKPPGG